VTLWVKGFGLFWPFLLCSPLSFRCIYFSANKEMKSCEQLLSELKAAGGPTLVPYEYTSAEKLLENAKMESNDNMDTLQRILQSAQKLLQKQA